MSQDNEEQQEASAYEVSELIGTITQYEREFKKWERRSEKIVKRYRDDARSDGQTQNVRFNILWSNVQTLIPATFSRLPQPDVSRRFRDTDPVGRIAALLLERALEYEVQHYPDYAESMKQVVQDRFLGGRGTSWVRYEPHFRAAKELLPPDGLEVSEDIDEPMEELDYECSPVDYVHYKDFGHSPARTWEEVPMVWRIVYMYEDAVEDRFGEEIAKSLPYDATPDRKDKNNGGEHAPKQAKIYEIWDKSKKKAVWLSRGLTKILDERDDPLGLSEFFPCPKPLYATLTNDTLVPVPDFVLYQDQADELDTLSNTIDGLIRALKIRGVYDASQTELGRLFSEAGNTNLIPVKAWNAFAEKNGLKGAIDLVDLAPIAQALREAYSAMSSIKEYVYEIMGVADIVRGQSNPNETLGAQQIKQNFAGLRLKAMQADVAKFAGDLLQIKGQIICAKYSPETIVKISAADQLSQVDQQFIPQAIELLIGQERMQNPEATEGPNPLRSFRIDVEADSLVRMDEEQEKSSRMEFLKAAGSFIKDALPVIQSAPQAAPLLVQMLKFGVTAFKVGKTIEGDFDQALDQLKQEASQPKPPAPNPEQMKMQQEAQEHQQEMQQRDREQQMQGMLEKQRNEMEHQREQDKQSMQMALEQQKMSHDMRLQEMQAASDSQIKFILGHLERITKLEVAEISKETTLTSQQISAAQAGEGNNY